MSKSICWRTGDEAQVKASGVGAQRRALVVEAGKSPRQSKANGRVLRQFCFWRKIGHFKVGKKTKKNLERASGKPTTPGLGGRRLRLVPQGHFCCGKREPEALRRRTSPEAAIKSLGELLFELLACQLYCHRNTSGRRRRSGCQWLREEASKENTAATDTFPSRGVKKEKKNSSTYIYLYMYFSHQEN